MTTKVREYIIRVPFSISEWRKGNRYIMTKLTTSEVKIVYHKTRKDEKALVTETHKVLDVKKKIPYIIKKVIPEDACVVDEFSTNVEAINISFEEGAKNVYNIETHIKNKDGIIADLNVNRTEIVNETGKGNEDVKINVKNVEEVGDSESKRPENGSGSKDSDMASNYSKGDTKSVAGESVASYVEDDVKSLSSCTTRYKNRHFDEKTFSLAVHTKLSDEYVKNIFKWQGDYKEETFDFRTFNSANMTKVGDRDYSGEWDKRYDSIYIYKLVEVSVNKFGFGWISSEIDKHVKNMLIDVQQKIIKSYDEWKDLKEEELVELEKDMIQRFLIKID